VNIKYLRTWNENEEELEAILKEHGTEPLEGDRF